MRVGCKPDECNADDFLKFAKDHVGLNDTLAKRLQTLYADEMPRPGSSSSCVRLLIRHTEVITRLLQVATTLVGTGLKSMRVPIAGLDVQLVD